jgi:hypothetical protein
MMALLMIASRALTPTSHPCAVYWKTMLNAVMLMLGRKLSSQDTLELLAEFGHGIQLRDYLIPQ